MWLPFLNIMFSRFISVVACVSYSFSVLALKYITVHITVAYSSVNGRLSCVFFFSFAIMNSISVNRWMTFCMNECLHFSEDIYKMTHKCRFMGLFFGIFSLFPNDHATLCVPQQCVRLCFLYDCSTVANILFCLFGFWGGVFLHNSTYFVD